MVSEEKVRIMTQIALDETKKHKEIISEGGYYKSDYVRSHVASAIGNCTVSYLLVLFLVALYHADYIFVNVARLEYHKIGIVILGVYAIFAVSSIFISYFYFTAKYAKGRPAMREYYSHLQKLEDYYTRNGEEAEDGTVTGT